MNKKRTLYRTLLILGLGLLAAALALTALLGNALPDTAGGAMVGVSSGLAAMGLANLLMLRQAEKDPRLARQTEIEEKDERNTAIRRRAKAVSGEVLQWTVLGAAWLSIALGAPLWVTLTAVGVSQASPCWSGASWSATRGRCKGTDGPGREAPLRGGREVSRRIPPPFSFRGIEKKTAAAGQRKRC